MDIVYDGLYSNYGDQSYADHQKTDLNISSRYRNYADRLTRENRYQSYPYRSNSSNPVNIFHDPVDPTFVFFRIGLLNVENWIESFNF